MYRRLNRVKRERDRRDAAEAQKAQKMNPNAQIQEQQQMPRHEGKKSQTNLRKQVPNYPVQAVGNEAMPTEGSVERLRPGDPNIDL